MGRNFRKLRPVACRQGHSPSAPDPQLQEGGLPLTTTEMIFAGSCYKVLCCKSYGEPTSIMVLVVIDSSGYVRELLRVSCRFC